MANDNIFIKIISTSKDKWSDPGWTVRRVQISKCPNQRQQAKLNVATQGEQKGDCKFQNAQIRDKNTKHKTRKQKIMHVKPKLAKYWI